MLCSQHAQSATFTGPGKTSWQRNLLFDQHLSALQHFSTLYVALAKLTLSVSWETRGFVKVPSLHMQLIHCWFPSCCRLKAVYASDCSLCELVSKRLHFWCRQGGITTLTAELQSTAFSRPQHSRRLYTCHPSLTFNHQGTLGKLYSLTNSHSTQITDSFQPNLNTMWLWSTPKKIPLLFHQAFDYLDPGK